MDDVAMPVSLKARVQNFAERQMELFRENYKEASTRIEFVDPLLAALGWDVSNDAGLAERFKDVVVEPAQEVDGHNRAPDYALRVDGVRRFFVEAKKPKIPLKNHKDSAFQARGYAWSAQLPVVVLTNFSEIAVYDGRLRPKPGDPASKARLLYITWDQLEERWGELYALVGRESVASGALELFVKASGNKGGTERIDRVFLRDLEETRQTLLAHVAVRNPHLTDSELLRSIQLTLDRMIFLRFCEDRGMERFGAVRTAVNSQNPRAALQTLYREADARYNSGLFHFDVEAGRVDPDLLTLNLNIDDDVIRKTVERFYPPQSPYAFSVMPVEVLGRAYESFLSWRITRAGGKVALEQKPEVRKAGGVYYTPEWLTRETVKRVLDPLLAGRTPESMARKPLRLLDPSCGSGSFLVVGYRYLLDWHLAQYAKDAQRWLPTSRRQTNVRLRKNRNGELALTARERKRILTDHIHGVDIDAQAVEVAKLSLLLTFMEDEEPSDASVALTGFKDRILPDIEANVRCGNSLIGHDVLTDDELLDVDDPARTKLNPFDWRAFGFEFDAVVGNPPWLMAGYETTARSLKYLKSKYSSYTGKADLYYLFIERSINLLTPNGRIGLVVPNKMFATGSAKGLRSLLSHSPLVESIVNFGAEQLFEGATNYSQILILDKNTAASSTLSYTRAVKYMAASQSWGIERARLNSEPWDLSSPISRAVYQRMEHGATRLDEIATGFDNGVQTGRDPLMILSKDEATALRLEPEFLRPLVRGRHIRDGRVTPGGEVIVFPYKEIDGRYVVLTPSQLTRAPWLQAYLESIRTELQKRKWFGQSATDLTGQWWGLMFVEEPAAFNELHLVTPAFTRIASFAVGGRELFPTGTAGVTGVRLPSGYDPKPLLALLNSPLLSAYALGHSPEYQGGFRKFSKPYIDSLPIKGHAAGERGTWDRLGDLWEKRMQLPPGASRAIVDTRISDLVLELYGVSQTELHALQVSVEPLADPMETSDPHPDL
ncbi:Eco57I restriction-modification methylase domain-containing protein [Pseudoclavibacter terrae]|uniref:site-specific DNA-methyltransferase (adenine-specific) n=1 Tax=Pseudoclavibacter terrae TaxID=1530195 RepID=A0A7J5B695_9MICO|nr:N-6 DNA methylase [Pseudoclavibacter terrae]KAB1639706.1 N-6 DNA methylase [Pseudoclavibacter terrae]